MYLKGEKYWGWNMNILRTIFNHFEHHEVDAWRCVEWTCVLLFKQVSPWADWLIMIDLPSVFLQLATWDSVHGLNGSLKESRIENGMQGVTIKVVTLLVRHVFEDDIFNHIQSFRANKMRNQYIQIVTILLIIHWPKSRWKVQQSLKWDFQHWPLYQSRQPRVSCHFLWHYKI